MSNPTNSFLKVYYDLRPAKQIERRMLIHSFHELRNLGCNISKYQYCGMGSIYFTDYILFHKYLGIEDMISVEYSKKAEKRVKFNRPYNFINILHEDISDTIGKLNVNKKHILWLDYDDVADTDKLETVKDAVLKLAPYSILLITFDSELNKNSEGTYDLNETYNYYKTIFGTYFERNLTIDDFKRENLAKTIIRLTSKIIHNALVGDNSKIFQPLYSFVYADGHQMLTMGGILLPKYFKFDNSIMNASSMNFLRFTFENDPYKIKIPLLTRKERLHLDSTLRKGRKNNIKEFEMEDGFIENYQEIYRYYPNYYESLL